MKFRLSRHAGLLCLIGLLALAGCSQTPGSFFARLWEPVVNEPSLARLKPWSIPDGDRRHGRLTADPFLDQRAYHALAPAAGTPATVGEQRSAQARARPPLPRVQAAAADRSTGVIPIRHSDVQPSRADNPYVADFDQQLAELHAKLVQREPGQSPPLLDAEWPAPTRSPADTPGEVADRRDDYRQPFSAAGALDAGPIEPSSAPAPADVDLSPLPTIQPRTTANLARRLAVEDLPPVPASAAPHRDMIVPSRQVPGRFDDWRAAINDADRFSPRAPDFSGMTVPRFTVAEGPPPDKALFERFDRPQRVVANQGAVVPASGTELKQPEDTPSISSQPPVIPEIALATESDDPAPAPPPPDVDPTSNPIPDRYRTPIERTAAGVERQLESIEFRPASAPGSRPVLTSLAGPLAIGIGLLVACLAAVGLRQRASRMRDEG